MQLPWECTEGTTSSTKRPEGEQERHCPSVFRHVSEQQRHRKYVLLIFGSWLPVTRRFDAPMGERGSTRHGKRVTTQSRRCQSRTTLFFNGLMEGNKSESTYHQVRATRRRHTDKTEIDGSGKGDAFLQSHVWAARPTFLAHPCT